MGQSTHRKFAITTGEVVFIFLFGLFIGALCMSIAGCSGEFTNVDMVKDSSIATMGLGSDSGTELGSLEAGTNIRIDGPQHKERTIDGGSSESNNDTGPVGTRDAIAPVPNVYADSGPKTGTEAGKESDSGKDSGSAVCQNCPSVLGRPGCCFELFKQCSSLNYLNVCVRPQ